MAGGYLVGLTRWNRYGQYFPAQLNILGLLALTSVTRLGTLVLANHRILCGQTTSVREREMKTCGWMRNAQLNLRVLDVNENVQD